MELRRIAAVGLAGVALVATTLIGSTGVAAAKSASPSTTPSCGIGGKDDPWPAWVQGRPKGIDPHTTAAIYMWHDTGWHIRVTHRTTNRRTFGGQLTTSGTFTGVKPVQLEKSDQLRVSSDKHAVTFLFKNYGLIDGVDFFTHCAPSITFTFQSDGKTSPPDKVVVGRNSAHPTTDPFAIARNSTGPTPIAN